MRRQVLAASSLILKARPRKVARVTPFLVRLVRWRTVAKVDSMGWVVRRCTPCSAGKAKKASRASRSFSSFSVALGYLAA